MKYWVQLLHNESDDIFASHLWETKKPLTILGKQKLILDIKEDKILLFEVASDSIHCVCSKKHSKLVTDEEIKFKDLRIRLVKIEAPSEVLQESIDLYAKTPIEIPLSQEIDLEELVYKKTQKFTFSSGAVVIALLFIFQVFFTSKVIEIEEIEKAPKLTEVKLQGAPTPSVVAAAYENALKQGAAHMAKTKPVSDKPAPKQNSVQNIKNAFASLMGGGLSGAQEAVPGKAVRHAAALLPGVQGRGGPAGARGRRLGSDGESVVKIAMTGSGDGGYQVGGDMAGIGVGGMEGQGAGWLSLNISDAMIDEGLSQDEVGKVIHAQISEIRYCYESSMLRKPEIEGKLVVDFVIANTGRVRAASVKESSVRDERLNECILKRLARWEFPKPKSGVEVAVSYPFIFKRLRR